MSIPEHHTFEVVQSADGRFAVYVDGVHIADHALEADALAHNERLQQQAQN